MGNATELTHLRGHVTWDIGNWSIHLVTDNSAFVDGGSSNKGGLIRNTATAGQENRIQVLYNCFTAPTPGTILTAANVANPSPDGWRWIQDPNNGDWNTPAGNGLGLSEIVYGNSGGGTVHTGATLTPMTNGNFAVNFAGIVNINVAGEYNGYPNLVLRAQ
jgi:hypothetical protein